MKYKRALLIIFILIIVPAASHSQKMTQVTVSPSAGPLLLGCLHPTGSFDRIKVTKVERYSSTLEVFTATIFWEGGVLGTPYETELKITMNNEAQTIQISVKYDSALVPYNKKCTLLSPVPQNKLEEAVRRSKQGALKDALKFLMSL